MLPLSLCRPQDGNICVRLCAEHIQLFYRLMCGTVFSDAYAVMCHNVKHTLLHQCGKTHCGLKVIGKTRKVAQNGNKPP